MEKDGGYNSEVELVTKINRQPVSMPALPQTSGKKRKATTTITTCVKK